MLTGPLLYLKTKKRSIALGFYHELASALSAWLKAAQKFFTEHWQQNKMDCGEDKGGGGGGGGWWKYFEVQQLRAKDNRKSLMRAEKCCNCGVQGVTVKMKQCSSSEIATQYRERVGFVRTSFGKMEWDWTVKHAELKFQSVLEPILSPSPDSSVIADPITV